MTPADILATRKQLGITQAQLAAALELGKDGRRIVRAWEKGEYMPSGPVRVALRLMLRERELIGLLEDLRSDITGSGSGSVIRLAKLALLDDVLELLRERGPEPDDRA